MPTVIYWNSLLHASEHLPPTLVDYVHAHQKNDSDSIEMDLNLLRWRHFWNTRYFEGTVVATGESLILIFPFIVPYTFGGVQNSLCCMFCQYSHRLHAGWSKYCVGSSSQTTQIFPHTHSLCGRTKILGNWTWKFFCYRFSFFHQIWN